MLIRWRALLPREHGLWAWVGVPLVAMGALCPGACTALAAGSVLAGFCGVNAWRWRDRGGLVPAALALGLAGLLGVGAVASAARPALVAALLAVGGLSGLAAGTWAGKALRPKPGVEAALIAGMAALAAGLAVGAGASVGTAAATLSVVATWGLFGRWHVGRRLSAVIPGRPVWTGSERVLAVAVAATVVAGFAAGCPWSAGLLLLYPMRARLHAPPRSGRDARRLGMTELAWATTVALAAGLLHGGGAGG